MIPTASARRASASSKRLSVRATRDPPAYPDCSAARPIRSWKTSTRGLRYTFAAIAASSAPERLGTTPTTASGRRLAPIPVSPPAVSVASYSSR